MRRELLRARKLQGVARLDAFNAASEGRYLPLTTTTMRRAAELWAQVRQAGAPTADRHAIDADVILATQAMSLQEQAPAGAIIATTNAGHLQRLAPAELWEQIGRSPAS